MKALAEKLQNAHVSWKANCPLDRYSSFQIGGSADLALFPASRQEILTCMTLLLEEEIPTVVIGKGSNVLFSDRGFRGAVLFTGGSKAFEVTGERIVAEAGASLSALSNVARDSSLSGLEFAFGIPGTLGGAVFMNAGAFGGCMQQVCVSSDYLDVENGKVGTLVGEAQGFGTRTSLYQRDRKKLILGATLALTVGERDTIDAAMREYSARRRATQPIELPNAGSIFKRPEGHFAGKLIEDCGLKGLRVGMAEVSTKHAGFIVNRGGATSEDVKALIEKIQAIVLQRTGVCLECEVRAIDEKGGGAYVICG